MSTVDNDIEVTVEPKIFWLEDFDGCARGGFFIKNNIKEFFKLLEDSGKTPVGIKFDGSNNLEIIVTEKED